jgi:hypothetical protein
MIFARGKEGRKSRETDRRKWSRAEREEHTKIGLKGNVEQKGGELKISKVVKQGR